MYLYNFLYFLYLTNFNLKIDDIRDEKLIEKNIQYLGNSSKNNIYRSFMSNHSHLDFFHLISNIFAINFISFLISDLFKCYYPIVLFYLTFILEHIFVEFMKSEESKVIGSSGCILGLYGFYFFNFLFNLKSFYNFNIIHRNSFWFTLFILINLIIEYKKSIDNKKDEDDNTSDISHITGFLIGFINYILYFLLIK